MNNPRLIAFYLPQFHPIPENDEWWGKGFTEWTNVTKSLPLFENHYQPHLPADLGFYDLRLKETRHAQIKLAKEFGIDGFCYHYYWFSGKRLLERPFNDMLSDPDSNMPFCICWANENWTRRWDGDDNELLIAQQYDEENDLNFIKELLPVLKDPRYIKVDGAPLIIVYRPQGILDANKSLSIWRDYAKSEGIERLNIYCAFILGGREYAKYGFDGGVEFPPHNLNNVIPKKINIPINERFTGTIFSFGEIANSFLQIKYSEPNVFNTVFPSWDNTARLGERSFITLDGTPSNYEYWLSQTIVNTKIKYQNKDSLVFINAWNEWAEGCHLEPDRKFGLQFLEATLRAKWGRSTVSKFNDSYPDLKPNRIIINEITFDLDDKNYREKYSTENHFVLLKTAEMIERISSLKSTIDPKYIFDLGIYKGGSCAFYNELFQPKKLVAIDFYTHDELPLSEYIKSRNLQNIVKPYFNINQSDRLALNHIYKTEFDNTLLDLVVDDASHFYEESKASFNILFPKLREDGVYIIEDWAWAHWPGEWQKPEGYFKKKKPLSILIIELIMACASNSPHGFIKDIKLSHNTVYIVRGPQPLDEKFDISERYLTRNEPLGSYDPRMKIPDKILSLLHYIAKIKRRINILVRKRIHNK